MRADKKMGLTIVELMVGMVAASVLSLTVGMMMYYSYRGWASVQSVGNMERDGALAMRTVAGVVQGASSSNVASVLAARFTNMGGRLVYKRTGIGDMDLVTNGVQTFSYSVATNKVSVVLNLSEPTAGVTMSMTNVVTTRN